MNPGWRCAVGLIAMVLAAPGTTRVDAAQPTIILLGHVAFPNSLFDIVATKYAKRVNEAVRGRGERLDKELLDKLAAKMKVNEADKEAFIKASAPIYEEIRKEVPGGTELVRHIQSLR